MQVLQRASQYLLGLFFPHLCLCCQSGLPAPGMYLCLTCQQQLPYTSLHQTTDNAFIQRFWGRVPLVYGAACFYFVKGGTAQQLIHQLKYAGQPQIGFHWGRIYGKKLLQSAYFREVEVIVPVPLHWKRERKRGYNQAATIARGIAEVLQRPLLPNGLERVRYTESLTRKSRLERLACIQDAFAVRRPDYLQGKHILLVDDVLTSGATLEACALPLGNLPDTRISMVTLGITMY